MRKRGKSFALWMLLVLGTMLFAVAVLFIAFFAKEQNWIPPELRQPLNQLIDWANRLKLTEEWKSFLIWLGGIVVSALGATFTLLASWHFLEMNLPQRLRDLIDSYKRAHMSLRPIFVAYAQP